MKCNSFLFIMCFFLSYTIVCHSSNRAPIVIQNYVTMPSSSMSYYGKMLFCLCSGWEILARYAFKNPEWGFGSFAMKHIGIPAFHYLQQKEYVKSLFNLVKISSLFNNWVSIFGLKNSEVNDELSRQLKQLKQELENLTNNSTQKQQQLVNQYQQEIRTNGELSRQLKQLKQDLENLRNNSTQKQQQLVNQCQQEIRTLEDNFKKKEEEHKERESINQNNINQVNQEKEKLLKQFEEIKQEVSKLNVNQIEFQNKQNEFQNTLNQKDDVIINLNYKIATMESSFNNNVEQKVNIKKVLFDQELVELQKKNQELLNQLDSKNLKEKEIAAQLKKQRLENNNFESAYQEAIKKQAFELFNKVWTKQVQQVMPQVAALELSITSDRCSNSESFFSLLGPLIKDLKKISTGSLLLPRPKL